jgi:peroxiredoxin
MLSDPQIPKPKGNRGLENSRINRNGLPAGTPAPVFRLPRLDGSELCLDKYQGQQVLLVFSDPNCGRCNQLAPQLEQLHRRTTDLQLLMISRGDPAMNRVKVAEHGLTFPVVLQRQWEISSEYGMFMTPIAYSIDERGIIARDVAVGGEAILAAIRTRKEQTMREQVQTGAESPSRSMTSDTSHTDPCTPPTNPIACENSKPGNPASDWDLDGDSDPSIQGFATDISVNRGETVHFKIKTDSTNYHLDIYRVGYYAGLGARKVATVFPSASLPQNQPDCLQETDTLLVDCGNWGESASWAVPSNATSGVYLAKLVRGQVDPPHPAGASHIIFIVRDDTGGSDILFQTSDTTWQAYNTYGGAGLYPGGPTGWATKVSYNRPFNNRGGNGIYGSTTSWFFNAEYPMVRWLEANGYNVSYFTGVDADRMGTRILGHKVFLSVGHDEYWSANQRANVEAARAARVHLAFFSGNEMFWKTRWESSIDGSATTYRTLVCYKETNSDLEPSPPME